MPWGMHREIASWAIVPAPAIPRAGVARELAGHVARAFGTRRVRRAVFKGLVALLEAYNEELHRPETATEVAARRLASTVLAFWSTLERVARSTSPVHSDRLLALGARSLAAAGDATVPECVLFLRAVIAAGVVAGEVSETTHAALDRFAIVLGVAWERERGELTSEGLRGAVAMLAATRDEGTVDPSPTDGRTFDPRAAAAEALAAFDASAREPLLAMLDRDELRGERRYTQYTPFYMRPVCAVTIPPPLGGFTSTWRPHLEEAMTELVRGEHRAFGAATSYLQAQGGKRFRGLLVLAAAAASGGHARDALPAAAAVEWLHQTSLILDDIVDEAEMRRGSPCLHRLTDPVFTVATSAFILARCGEAIRELPAEVGRALLDAELALLEGECLELATTPARASLDRYYRIVAGKTASLFECAARVGALCATEDRRVARALATYGREVGLAFQIVDDLLDYTGSEAELGKRPGIDFANGRLTLPAILLAGSPPARDFASTRAAILAGDVPARCRARAAQHVQRARAALATLPDNDGRRVLDHLATAILDRTS